MMHMYETDLLQEDAIEESLSHHGIKGQKWHLRRFQNPDGTYTELGKERRRVGYEDPDKKKEDEDGKSKSSKSTEPVLSEQTKEELIGGKAYKDMTRRELRAAKRRARHNEKERRATREFNRDKRQAIEDGNMSFISKNISKFSNEEIDEAMFRFKKMQDLRNLEQANRKDADHYIDKALHYLEKADKGVKFVTNISNNINEASKKKAEKNKAWIDYEYTRDPSLKPLTENEKLKNESVRKENLKKDEQIKEAKESARLKAEEANKKAEEAKEAAESARQKRAEADMKETERDEKKYVAQSKKEVLEEAKAQEREAKEARKAAQDEAKRAQEQYKEAMALRKQYADQAWARAEAEEAERAKKVAEAELHRREVEEEQRKELTKRAEKEAKKVQKEYEEYEKDVSRREKEIEKLEKENQKLYKEAMKAMEEQAEEDAKAYKLEVANSNANTYSNMSDLYREDGNYSWFGSKDKKQKLGSWFSKEKKNSGDFDLDDEAVNAITKKYLKQVKKSDVDYFKEPSVRNDQWKKDLKKHDSDVIDDWIKDMKKKYMKERNMDSKAAEKKAEEYVEAWLDAYDEGKLF